VELKISRVSAQGRQPKWKNLAQTISVKQLKTKVLGNLCKVYKPCKSLIKLSFMATKLLGKPEFST